MPQRLTSQTAGFRGGETPGSPGTRWRSTSEGIAAAAGPLAAAEAGPRTVRCERCGDRGWLFVTQADGAGAARRCPCRRQRMPQRLLDLAGIPPRYAGCRLSSFQVAKSGGGVSEPLVRARAECQRYVEGFLDHDAGGSGRFRESGLLLIGPPGTGKTHLAVAVLRELIAGYGVRGCFVDFTSLLHDIQSTFDSSTPESKQDLLDPIQEAEVLVLDELGAQKMTPWVSEILYLVINGRYARRLPTLFTSNYPLGAEPEAASGSELTLEQRIPQRLLSRLYEMATPVRLDGVDDFRREIGKAGYRD